MSRFSPLFILLLTILLSACDFTTGVYRQVLDAQELINKNNYQEAIKKYESILSQNPPIKLRYKIYYQLATVYHQNLLKPRRAISYYKKINDFAIDKKLVELSFEKAATVSFNNKLYLEAIRFLEVDKTNPLENNFKIGICYFELNNFELAQKKFKEIISLTISKKNYALIAKSYFYLGQISSYSNDWQESIDYWENTLKYSRDSDEIIQTKFYIANSYERVFELEKAYKYYYSIINFYPNPEIIKKRLKRVYDRKLSRRR